MSADQRLEAEARVRELICYLPRRKTHRFANPNELADDLTSVLSDLTSARTRIAELEAGMKQAADELNDAADVIQNNGMRATANVVRDASYRARALLKDTDHG